MGEAARTGRRYGGVPAAQREQSRREQLLEAVIAVLEGEGANRLTVRRVAARAGLSTRFVYESFADLNDLTGAAFDMVSAELARALGRAVQRAGADRRACMTAVVEAIVDFFLADPAKGKFLSTKAYAHPGVAGRRLARSEDYVGAFAGVLRNQLGDKADDRVVELTSRFLVAGFGETVTAWIHEPSAYSRDEFVRDNVELFLGALAAAEGIAGSAAADGRMGVAADSGE
ncbi:TetR/AcrR family transcriptional regulator [Nocardia transvalensis]|uniref:TetR/AcrR family transcriptional regulator n=1 Tax=Nocardia transvalensis TaxID=37333 RepID=UPI001895C1BE|nr:TetR/AcrR family transcriptional regulator [Nocardia transvalensis]MBF6332862.1 TetR family transcriptional regulator [Nocardia transvalensis]